LPDLVERGIDRLPVRCCDHEPQVVVVFTFVIMIDLGEFIDEHRHLFQLCRRHGHGRQGAGTDGVGPEYRADPADYAVDLQFPEVRQHGPGAGAQFPGDPLEGLGI
jgi:hypothetical protein